MTEETPVTTEAVEEYKTKYNALLKEHNLKIVNARLNTVMKISWFVLFAIFLVFLLSFVSQGKFKTELNQSISSNTQVNNSVNNAYSFTPRTENTYQIYLNATIQIPSVTIVENHS